MTRTAISRAGSVLQAVMEAAAIGALSGLTCAGVRLFFRLLQWCVTGDAGLLPHVAEALPLWRRALTPALGGIGAMTVTFLLRRKRAPNLHAIEYVEAVRFEGGRIPLRATLWRTLSSAFSVATGAPIGREGSMIQFAAAVVSFTGQRLRWAQLPLADLVACGAAAGVAAAYQAPAAGVFFALEIVMGRFAWRTVPWLTVSAMAGELASRVVLPGGPLFVARGSFATSWGSMAAAVALAAVLGALGPGYLWLLRSLQSARRLTFPLLWSGAAAGAASLLATQVWGNGDAALLSILQAHPAFDALALVLVLRLCTTTFCVGTGTVGGVFTPTVFVGGAVGLLLCQVVHGPQTLLFTVVGMGALLAAATHAPWMASFMTAELTGAWAIFPLILVCNLLAWQIARRLSRHSLYAIASDLPAALPRPDLVPEADPDREDKVLPLAAD
jgi:chloride channel protein, CIC family